MEVGDYRFAHPLFLLLVFLIPVGIWFVVARVKRGTLRFSSLVPFRNIRPSARVRLRFLVPFLRVAALLLLVVALARPQKGSELAPEKSRGIGILVVFDASGSMLQEDFQLRGRDVSRIAAVKAVVHEFIKGEGNLPGRPHDEVGVLSFTGYPVPRAPLTLDHGAVLEVLQTIEAVDGKKMQAQGIPVYPEDVKTAIGDALAKGAEFLRDVDVKSRIMVLLSDGSQNMGVLSEEEGATIAKSFGIKVYTIGIGRAGIVMQTVNDPLFGPRKVRKMSDLDEATLKRIAEITGGQYFNAADTQALREVYKEIDVLERSDITTTRFYRWDEKFQPLALGALLLVVLEVLLGQTLFRRLP